MAESVLVLDLGRRDYQPTWDLQRRIQAGLVRAKRADPPAPAPHVVLLVEHPPVYTLGKSGDESNLLKGIDELSGEGFEFHKIDRGGDITYHGPGQLVVYPLLDLDRFFTDIHRYLRELEEAVILTCADYGIDADRVDGRTGVWIGPDARGAERKVCAMGIRCSRWVTMHGLAFNVSTDLSHFGNIIPCGITDRAVTSLEAEMGSPVSMQEVARRLVGHLADRFGMTVSQPHDADTALDAWFRALPAAD